MLWNMVTDCLILHLVMKMSIVWDKFWKSVMKREEYSVVSTSPRSSWFERAKKNRESVKKLDIGAIDLHLIHCPRPGKILETWKAMIEWKKGLSKSIDISNFNIQHVKQITESGMESWNSSMESIGSFSWQLTK